MAETYIKNLGKVCITPEGVWNKNAQYNRLCLVSLTGDDGLVYSYISRKEVPAGIEIGNTDYWQLVANSFSVENWGVGEDGYIYIGGVKTNYKIGLNDALADEVIDLLSDRLADLVAGKIDQVIGSKLQQILTEGVKLQVEPTGEIEVECVCNKDSNSGSGSNTNSGNSGDNSDNVDSGNSGDNTGDNTGTNTGGDNTDGDNNDSQPKKYSITIGSLNPNISRAKITYSIRKNDSILPFFGSETEIQVGDSFVVNEGETYKISVSVPYSSTEQNYKGSSIQDTPEDNITLDLNCGEEYDAIKVSATGDVTQDIKLEYSGTNGSLNNNFNISPKEWIFERGHKVRIIAYKKGYTSQVIVDTINLQQNINTAINLTQLEEDDLFVDVLNFTTQKSTSREPYTNVSKNGNTINVTLKAEADTGGNRVARVVLLVDSLSTPQFNLQENMSSHLEQGSGLKRVYYIRTVLNNVEGTDYGSFTVSNGTETYTINLIGDES